MRRTSTLRIPTLLLGAALACALLALAPGSAPWAASAAASPVVVQWGPAPNGYPPVDIPCGGSVTWVWDDTASGLPHDITQVSAGEPLTELLLTADSQHAVACLLAWPAIGPQCSRSMGSTGAMCPRAPERG